MNRNNSFKMRRALRQEQVMLLRAQGFTIRQICEKVNVKSTDTIHKDIKECIERVNARTDLTTEEHRDMQLEMCNEAFGEIADMLQQVDKMKLAKQAKISLKLSLYKTQKETQLTVIKLRGLEAPQKIQHSGTIDFNKFRERAEELESERMNIPAAALGRA